MKIAIDHDLIPYLNFQPSTSFGGNQKGCVPMSIQDELPRSRINLKYRTTIDGVPRELELPLRLLVLGDFSLGASEDRKTGLENRRIRSLDGGNIDSIMGDMKMRVSFQDNGAACALKHPHRESYLHP